MRTLLICALCSTGLVTAATQMSVAVCNPDGVHNSIVAAAKTETDLVFRSAGVTIVWRDCTEFPTPTEQQHDPWFVIRLRTDRRPKTAGPASLDVMGKAFVNEHGGGNLADAYIEAIRDTSDRLHGETGVLLGFVMAHELGHLILGSGHTPDGVMQGSWGKPQMNALRQRWLKFSDAGAARVRRALETLQSDGQ